MLEVHKGAAAFSKGVLTTPPYKIAEGVNDLDKRREAKLKKAYEPKPLEDLTLMDDYMFFAVMRDKANLKPLLEYILNVTIDDIEFVEAQKTEKEGYRSKGIRLDLYVKDIEGQIYNVEVQARTSGNLPKRMRYYQSVIDVNILEPGVDYSKLMKSYVIFICGFDPFARERYRYTFGNNCFEEEDLPLGDETAKIVVNTKGTKGDISAEMKAVLLYLDKGLTSSDYTRQLDDAVQSVKCSEERRHEYMVMMIREMEIREEGRILGVIETMRADGKDDQAIIDRLVSKYDLSLETAKEYVFSFDLTARTLL